MGVHTQIESEMKVITQLAARILAVHAVKKIAGQVLGGVVAVILDFKAMKEVAGPKKSVIVGIIHLDEVVAALGEGLGFLMRAKYRKEGIRRMYQECTAHIQLQNFDKVRAGEFYTSGTFELCHLPWSLTMYRAQENTVRTHLTTKNSLRISPFKER